MLFRKSKYVETTVMGERQRYTRPHCDVQLEWLGRLADISQRQKDTQAGAVPGFGSRLALDADELRQMREDLAHHLNQVEGEECSMTADEIAQVTSPTEVFAAWVALLNICQLQESDRGKSDPRSTSPSTTAGDMTAGLAPTRPNGRDAALSP